MTLKAENLSKIPTGWMLTSGLFTVVVYWFTRGGIVELGTSACYVQSDPVIK